MEAFEEAYNIIGQKCQFLPEEAGKAVLQAETKQDLREVVREWDIYLPHDIMDYLFEDKTTSHGNYL